MKAVIAVLAGDGIGPEVVDSTIRIIEATGAPIEWEERHAGERPLSTREQGELLATLQGWTSIDLNSGSARFAVISEAQLRITATEEELEVRCKGGL